MSCGTDCSVPTSFSHSVRLQTSSRQKVKCNLLPPTSSPTSYTLLEAALAQKQQALILCVGGPQGHPQDR